MDWEKQYRDACKSIDSLTAERDALKEEVERLRLPHRDGCPCCMEWSKCQKENKRLRGCMKYAADMIKNGSKADRLNAWMRLRAQLDKSDKE